jgi:hypothetical protein
MNKSFCPSCGKPNIYTLEKPEFCRFCNSELSFASQTIKPPQNKLKAKIRRPIEIEYEEDDADFSNIRSSDIAEAVNDGNDIKRSYSFEQVVNPDSPIAVGSRRSSNKQLKDVNQILKNNGERSVIDIGGDE